MKNKIDPPKITGENSLLPQQIHTLQSKEEISHCLISDSLIEYQEAARVSFDKVIFRNVTIAGSTLNAIELTDVIFEHCDLSNVNFSDAFVHRTEFRNCKLTGTDFSRGRFQNVRIVDCIGDFASFRFGKFKGTAFVNCRLVSSDYYQAGLNHVEFSECDIDQATFEGCRLKEINLSDCRFAGLHVDIEDLAGCIISVEQAASFAGLLGLIIKTDADL
ncbi:Pentapeptide repeats (8 copies) [compost metagenome]